MSNYTRRDLGKLTLAVLPLAKAAAAPNSKIAGVQLGAISYSFRSLSAEEIIPAFVKIGLNEVELMSSHAEALAGAPRMPARPSGGPGPGSEGKGAPTAEQKAAARARMSSPEAQKAREALANWRKSVSMDKFKEVRKKFNDAGIQVHLLCYNMNQNTADDDIDYGFQAAKALGVKAISCTTQVSVSKRVAPFADKHKIMIGFHNHSAVDNPNEFATIESFTTAMSYSRYHAVNLDIGHFTAGNLDAVAYIKENHSRITNLHLKDRKKNQGPNVVWGQGDTPIREVLQLLRKSRYSFPANIEYEYRGEGDPVTEVTRCFQYCKDALA